MEILKELFGEKTLTYEDFVNALNERKDVKLANLAEGRYVDKDKLDAKVRELDMANASIKELTEKLQAFDGVDVDKLKADVKSWEVKYNTDLAAVKKDAAIDAAILQAKGRNPKAIKALLDMDKIKLKEDGSLEGLDLDGLKKSEGYLFDIAEMKQQGAGVASGNTLKEPEGFEGFLSSARTAAGLKN